jgi:hypothetical protein
MTDVGRVPDGTRLSQAEPEEVSALTGFDPSRFKPDSYEGKPRNLSKPHRAVLNQFVDFIDSRIDEMTPLERRELLDACLSVSPINCAWDTYKVAEVVIWHLQETAIATEAGTAETVQHGSVHEGAGLQASPKPSPTGDQR